MNKLENPIQFNIKQHFSGIDISYTDLMEISQGGPEVGKISVNGKLIATFLFGGPIIYQDNYIYAPVFIRKFFKSGFRIAKINVQNLEVQVLGKYFNLIFLDKIDNQKIYFFLDMDKTISGDCDV